MAFNSSMLDTTFRMLSPIPPPDTAGFTIRGDPHSSKILSSGVSSRITLHAAVCTAALSKASFIGIFDVVIL